MGWISSLFSASPAGGVIDAVGRTVDAIFTSDEEKLQAKYLMEKLRQQPYILQAEINKVEAAHKSVFVAGWRPLIGWVCGLSFGMVFLVGPILQMFGLPYPVIEIEALITLTLALLGFGGVRAFEKLKGVATNKIKK